METNSQMRKKCRLVMRTCWVLDHPAHVRLMLPLLQKSGTRDLIIASNRAEIRQLLATAEGLLPTRELHWVERPVGRYKIVKAWMRIRKVKAIFRRAAKNNMPVKRVVGVGAPLELIAHQSLRHHRHSSFERWYITDTEVNHVAHRLAKRLRQMLWSLLTGMLPSMVPLSRNGAVDYTDWMGSMVISISRRNSNLERSVILLLFLCEDCRVMGYTTAMKCYPLMKKHGLIVM